MTHYVVTGGAGAVGSNLVRLLLREQTTERVVVVDDLSSGYRWLLPVDPRVEFIQDDVVEWRKQGGIPQDAVVFHLAAFFANQNSIDHPLSDLHTNGAGILSVLLMAQKARAARVVYASAGCSIVQHGDDEAIREDMPPSLHLDTPYQITKALGEYYCNYFLTQGLSTVRCRFFNSYGPREVPGKYRNVIPNFIWAALHDRPLVITGTGEETRDFIFVEDLVEGLWRAAHVPEAHGEAINLGTGRQCRILDLAQLIIKYCHSKSEIQLAPRRIWDHSLHREADNRKAQTLLGFRPLIEVPVGLAITVAWCIKHRDEIRQVMEEGGRG